MLGNIELLNRDPNMTDANDEVNLFLDKFLKIS